MKRVLLGLLAVAAGGAGLWFAAPHLPALRDSPTTGEPPAAGSPEVASRADEPAPKDGSASQSTTGDAAEAVPATEGEAAPGVVPPVALTGTDQEEAADGEGSPPLAEPAGINDQSDTSSGPPFAAGLETVPDEPSAPVIGEPEPDPEHGAPLATELTGDDAPGEPTFDIVRIEPDGRSVIAGRAEPGAQVEIRAGDRVIDKVIADRRGQWVATPAEPLRAKDRELSLVAIKGDVVTPSAGTVLIAFAEPPSPQPPARVVGEAPPPQPPPAVHAEASSDAPAATAEEQAIAVLMQEGGGVGRVLQAPGRISGGGQLALMVVDYDPRGRVQLSGEAPPGAPVRVYVDNQPAAEVVARDDGTWRTVLEQPLAPGDYTLRLDQLGPSGEPVARLETPFTRAGPPAAAEDGGRVDYVIVQPGNSLWRISRRLFGSGFHYVEIYETNRAQIRDPDLIYPGQVFTVPGSLNDAS